MKIAVFSAKSYDIAMFNKINDGSFNYQIDYFRDHLKEDTTKLANGYDAICIFVNDLVNRKIAEDLAKNGVKLVALRCAGFNNVDLKALEDNNLGLVRVPSYSPHAIAEHAMALILSLNRKIHRAYMRTRDGNFSLHGLQGFDLYGKTAGIIGTGKIAKALIAILKGFGMNVLAYDPFPDEASAKNLGFTYCSLDEIYKNADVISLHCPLTDDTHYIINENSIAKMKKGVMIINTGRGKLIHTEDLIKGLKSGQIGYAGLDVYEEESELFFTDKSDFILNDDILARLLTFNNVIVTSHQAFFTKEAVSNIVTTTLQNIKDFFLNLK